MRIFEKTNQKKQDNVVRIKWRCIRFNLICELVEFSLDESYLNVFIDKFFEFL